MGPSRDVIAIVPAAGESRRMGRPKLILPIGGRSVIARVVEALLEGGVSRVIVVVPTADRPESASIARSAEDAGGEVVVCHETTPDMRATVTLGLRSLGAIEPIGWLLAPGDSPALSARIVSAVLARFGEDPSRIVVPTHAWRRGHPVAFPRATIDAVLRLPPDQGIDALVRSAGDRLSLLEVAEPGILDDLDTPEDYRRWSNPDGPGSTPSNPPR